MRKIILNTNTKKALTLIKLNFHRFSEKSNIEKDIEAFNLKFDKATTFEDFKAQMDKNIDIGLNSEIDLKDISNTKLLDMLREKGIDKTKEEIEVLSKILSQRGKETVSQICIILLFILYLYFYY